MKGELEMNNHEVTIQGDYRLSGTLTIPEGAQTTYPAILIISGSGKGDRDGNIKQLKMNMYKDLAGFFTSKGLITLRYDKRGTYQSGGNFLETGFNDLINDAAECIKFLQSHPKVNKEKILILGHSEGALIAPAVHHKVPVSGIILLAGGAESSKDLMKKQSEMAHAEMNSSKGFKGWIFRTFKVVEKAQKQNEKIFKKMEESDQAVMRVQGIKINAKWMRETRRYNVCGYLKEVTCPVLAVTGEKDIQVPPDHVKLMAEMVKGEAEWHIIADMNHILRKYKDRHTILGIMKEYKSLLDQPIDSDLLEILGTWVEKYA